VAWTGAGAAVLVLIVAALAVRSRVVAPGAAAPERPTLVVLPFQNLGAPEDEYFADGISEEITSRLAQISGLGVISRQSATQYKGSAKPLRQIGQELGAHYALEGTIRTDRVPGASGRVRVTPQLVRVSDDTHLWAGRYDAELKPGELFAIQSGIAQQVAEALGVTLLGSERRGMDQRPTASLEAYEQYLRGKKRAALSYGEADMRAAIEHYDRAVVADSSFALAWAALSQAHSDFSWFSHDRSPTRCALSRAAADRALALGPDLPEAHIAMGAYHYHCRLAYGPALAELAVALPRRPNDVQLLSNLSAVKRRQGEWDDAVSSFRRWTEVDPLSPLAHWELGLSLMLMRQYDLADQRFSRLIGLAPRQADTYLLKAMIQILRDGDVPGARRWFHTAVDSAGAAGLVTVLGLYFMTPLIPFLDDAVRDRLLELPASAYRLDPAATRPFVNGVALWFAGRRDAARPYLDSARVALEPLARAATDYYGVVLPHSFLAQVHAGLGRYDEAVVVARQAVELRPLSRDAFWGANALFDLATVYAQAGDAGRATAELEQLLSIPAWVSRASLRVDSRWDPIRGDPRFQRLLGDEQAR
jgi:TolB-like protein/Flp pilus assembly protein TadD